MNSVPLLRVAAAWPLPGLGLLALPDGPTPLLTAYDLHTPLAIVLCLPNGTQQPSFATVEEVSGSDDNKGPVRGLLLDLGATRDLPVATSIWLAPLVK